MAEMIWCNRCKTVVWAYDHQPHMDIRGWLNEVYMPCPLCAEEGNFDGWGDGSAEETIQNLKDQGLKVYDRWSLMKAIAKMHKVEWNPSPDNRWFRSKMYTPIIPTP